jgi:asparagine synthase (glutamine-hydrolysing)
METATKKLLDVLAAFDTWQPAHFGLVTPKKRVAAKNLELLTRQAPDASAAAAYISSKPEAASSYDFLQLEDAALFFEGRVYSPVSSTAQIRKESAHCEASLQTLIGQADGDYAFWLLKDGWVAAGRDPVGVQPLYFGENHDVAAFATNRRALWKLGIETPKSFPPGNLAYANREGFQFKPVKTLVYSPPEQVQMDEAAKKLGALLEESVRRRVQGSREVAVAFSGGLDSSIVSYLANRVGANITLLHVSLENQPETEEAIEAAEALDLPLEVHLFKDSDVEKTLPRVVALIEEADPVKASIGLPFYWAAEKASEVGFKVMLAGQGADELFGGYQRYVAEACREGGEKTRKTMFDDVVCIHESNLERDLKICSFHDVELRCPFANFELAEFALSLPIECKLEAKADTLRKLVLRKMALDAGLPEPLANKPKKAVQYSTGINDAVKRVAKKNGQTVNQYVSELFERSKKGVVS